ncbi:hypothetical protein L1887_09088 [Cichorium endivia]|nr:hypothetical protein L1887_09088 [Cichorium endivia]
MATKRSQYVSSKEIEEITKFPKKTHFFALRLTFSDIPHNLTSANQKHFDFDRQIQLKFQQKSLNLSRSGR